MRLDFQKYDEISRMEMIIEAIINHNRLDKLLISLGTEDNQKRMILTMISMLYKQKCHHEYVKNHIIDDDEISNIKIIYEIIDILNEELKKEKILSATRKVNENGNIIQIFLEKYFEQKNINYITNKHFMKLVIEQGNQKELLSYNPYAINQLLEYIQNPLTKEEIIIADLLEYNSEAENTFNRQEKILTSVKELMKQNYKGEQLDDAIAFILSDVYQEIIENYYDSNRNLIKSIIENKEVEKTEIIEHFKENDAFSIMILNKFFLFNKKLYEGRLKELEQKESKKYAKRIYDK